MTRQPQVPKDFSHYLARKDHYNVIFPSEKVLSVSPLHKLIPEVIRLSADPEDGDVWNVGLDHAPQGSKTELFSFSKRGLQRIAQAAGIVFDPLTTHRTDDAKNPRRVEYKATGSIQKPDGSWYTISQSKEIDLDQIEKEERERIGLQVHSEGAMSSAQNQKIEPSAFAEEIERRVRQSMLIWTKNKLAFAETGAHNRVIRALLILKPFYTREELARPFVVPRVSLNVEYMLKSLEFKEHLLEGGLSWIWSAFGPKRFAVRPDRSFITVREREPRASDESTPNPSVDETKGGRA
jgi:hypothetical protein